jgi:hypothetical protein
VQQEIGSDSAEGPCAPLEAICGAPSEPTTNSVGCGSVEPAPSAVNVPLELTADPPAAWAAPVVAAGGTEDCSQISGWPTHEAAHEATHEAAHQAAHRAARALVQELTRPIDRALQSACDGQPLDVVEVGRAMRMLGLPVSLVDPLAPVLCDSFHAGTGVGDVILSILQREYQQSPAADNTPEAAMDITPEAATDANQNTAEPCAHTATGASPMYSPILEEDARAPAGKATVGKHLSVLPAWRGDTEVEGQPVQSLVGGSRHLRQPAGLPAVPMPCKAAAETTPSLPAPPLSASRSESVRGGDGANMTGTAAAAPAIELVAAGAPSRRSELRGCCPLGGSRLTSSGVRQTLPAEREPPVTAAGFDQAALGGEGAAGVDVDSIGGTAPYEAGSTAGSGARSTRGLPGVVGGRAASRSGAVGPSQQKPSDPADPDAPSDGVDLAAAGTAVDTGRAALRPVAWVIDSNLSEMVTSRGGVVGAKGAPAAAPPQQHAPKAVAWVV